jgi:hypothetical protein
MKLETEEVAGDEARFVDPEVERRVVRKIDMFLMPAMVIGKLSSPFLPRMAHLIIVVLVIAAQVTDSSTTTRPS